VARDWQHELAKVPRVPDFFLVGAPKCGTTTVYSVLRSHPDVFLPIVKEPHFFSRYQVGRTRSHLFRPIESGRAYARLYRSAGRHQVLGDMSTSYLYNEGANTRIHDANPDARILVGLRDPIQRAYSGFLMVQRNSGSAKTFLEAVSEAIAAGQRAIEAGQSVAQKLVYRGLYTPAVQRFVETFGKEAVFVFTTHQLRHQHEETVAGICKHIDVDPGRFGKPREIEDQNAFRVPSGRVARYIATSRGIRSTAQKVMPYRLRRYILESMMSPAKKPELAPEAARALTPIYRDDVQSLERLLDRKLPELRASFVED
jgi:hypothetical protein